MSARALLAQIQREEQEAIEAAKLEQQVQQQQTAAAHAAKTKELTDRIDALLATYDTLAAELRDHIEVLLLADSQLQTLRCQSRLPGSFRKVHLQSVHDMRTKWESGFSTTEMVIDRMSRGNYRQR